jgi:hypothetical protein
MSRLCWWCCHPWDGVELHLPYKINPRTKEYMTMGQFCSWNCMIAYNHGTNIDHKVGVVNSLIAVLYKKMTNDGMKIPKRAPNKYVLKSFGGTIEIEEFRKLNGASLPIISFPNQMQKVQNVLEQKKLTFNELSENQLDSKIKIIKNSKSNSETLKLKRSKPLKRDVNNLETMMNLTISKK